MTTTELQTQAPEVVVSKNLTPLGYFEFVSEDKSQFCVRSCAGGLRFLPKDVWKKVTLQSYKEEVLKRVLCPM